MIPRILTIAAVLLAGAALLGPARATTVEPGRLLASQSCEAFHSLKKRTNPGNVRLRIGADYPVLGRNGHDGDHLLLKVPGARPAQRWVSETCGELRSAGAGNSGGGNSGAGNSGAGNSAGNGIGNGDNASGSHSGNAGRYVLALSWQPTFCELNRGRPECRNQRAERRDARQLSLHGLWPHGQAYCGASAGRNDSRWGDLPEPRLDRALRTALAVGMPGMISGLHRHQWHKHGSCYGEPAQDYFAESLTLLRWINASAVGELFRANIGRQLSAQQVSAAFERAFGPGSGKRVALRCKQRGGRRMIAELRIELAGDIGPRSRLGELLRAAPPVRQRCRGGLVDPAGFSG